MGEMRISVFFYFQNIQPRERASSTCGVKSFQAVSYGCQAAFLITQN